MVIDSASEMSSNQAGIGSIRTVRIAMRPIASAMSPRRTTAAADAKPPNEKPLPAGVAVPSIVTGPEDASLI
ncbi:hypothetical protein TMPK1_36790 [Rhodospirillales bacterium TMPK1]|uniref:Uncharacterized protein n=1 Tax=Roseiterribacter gracilis TaxID=2812848 RepID=A0A8S8XHJ4_9PROT|nr:hypothetical protein TMPK1_36790 [Rhodospirillales bacterium TMPK1]